MSYIKRIVALLLCALLLGGMGCAWALDEERVGTPFGEIVYCRPSLTAMQNAVDALEEALARGEEPERLEKQLGGIVKD